MFTCLQPLFNLAHPFSTHLQHADFGLRLFLLMLQEMLKAPCLPGVPMQWAQGVSMIPMPWVPCPLMGPTTGQAPALGVPTTTGALTATHPTTPCL